MILYPSQQCVLLALQNAEFQHRNNPENAKIFDVFAQNFLNHPSFQRQVEFLIDKGLITENGEITPKGRLHCSVEPKFLNHKELGVRTNTFLFESMNRGILGRGLSFMDEDTLLQLASYVDAELTKRYPTQMEGFKEAEIALADQAAVEDHIIGVQSPEVIVNGQITTTEEATEPVIEPVKKAKKVKV